MARLIPLKDGRCPPPRRARALGRVIVACKVVLLIKLSKGYKKLLQRIKSLCKKYVEVNDDLCALFFLIHLFGSLSEDG